MRGDDVRESEAHAGCLFLLALWLGVVSLAVWVGVSRGVADAALFLGVALLLQAAAIAVGIGAGWFR